MREQARCEREKGDGEQATGDGCGHETMQADTKQLHALAW